jgi:hypothetical protein
MQATPHAHALRLLIGLALCRDEAARALETIGGEPDASGLRDSVVIEHLAACAEISVSGREKLDEILAAQVRRHVGDFQRLSPYEIAAVWARQRHRLRGKKLAALLYAATRNDTPAWHQLEARLAEEIEVLALRSLVS